MKIAGTIHNGKLSCIYDIIGYLATQKDGKNLIVEIKGVTRSNAQNSYYFGVVIPLIKDAYQEQGNLYSSESIHQFLARNVGNLTEMISTPAGDMEVVISTASLSTEPFEKYLQLIRVWAADNDNLGIRIPLPNEGITWN